VAGFVRKHLGPYIGDIENSLRVDARTVRTFTTGPDGGGASLRGGDGDGAVVAGVHLLLSFRYTLRRGDGAVVAGVHLLLSFRYTLRRPTIYNLQLFTLLIFWTYRAEFTGEYLFMLKNLLVGVSVGEEAPLFTKNQTVSTDPPVLVLSVVPSVTPSVGASHLPTERPSYAFSEGTTSSRLRAPVGRCCCTGTDRRRRRRVIFSPLRWPTRPRPADTPFPGQRQGQGAVVFVVVVLERFHDGRRPRNAGTVFVRGAQARLPDVGQNLHVGH